MNEFHNWRLDHDSDECGDDTRYTCRVCKIEKTRHIYRNLPGRKFSTSEPDCNLMVVERIMTE